MDFLCKQIQLLKELLALEAGCTEIRPKRDGILSIPHTHGDARNP